LWLILVYKLVIGQPTLDFSSCILIQKIDIKQLSNLDHYFNCLLAIVAATDVREVPILLLHGICEVGPTLSFCVDEPMTALKLVFDQIGFPTRGLGISDCLIMSKEYIIISKWISVILLKLFVWKFSEKLIIGCLHRNNRVVMLITKLNQCLSFLSENEVFILCMDPCLYLPLTFHVDPFLLRLIFTPILGVTLRIS
ncbi:hypothetical protein ACJX0J_025558, partial [Zea mays]